MLAVPKIDRASVAFGNIKHMPKYRDLPEEFQDWHYHPFCQAISHWFMKGCEPITHGICIKGVNYVAKVGVDSKQALAAISSVMRSWEPKHEHKIAACGYMLHEWFEVK
jgi:hypothetical protein